MLIERYLARALLKPVWGVMLFLVVVVAVFYSARLLGQAATENLPVQAVLTMAGLRLVLYLDVLIPVAVLLGAVIGLGRVHQANELVALHAAGLSRFQMFRTLGVWLVGLVLVVAALSMWVRPWGYGVFYGIEAQLAERLDITRIEPGRFQVGDEQWLIYAQTRQGMTLYDVFVHQRTATSKTVFTADEMTQTLEPDGLIRLVFRGNITSHTLPQASQPNPSDDLISGFDELTVVVEPTPIAERQKIRRAMPMTRLADAQAPIEIAEWQWRWVSPLSVVVMALSALVLVSQKPRGHRAWALLLALVIATVYFSAVGVLVNWVEKGLLSPFPGVFIAPGVLFLWVVSMSLARHLRWLR